MVMSEIIEDRKKADSLFYVNKVCIVMEVILWDVNFVYIWGKEEFVAAGV